MNQFRSFAVWIVIGLLLFALFSLFQGQSMMRAPTNDISYSDFLNQVNDGTIKSVTAANSGQIIAKTADGKTVTTFGPLVANEDEQKAIRAKGVDVVFQPAQGDSILSTILIYWLPMLLIAGVWFFVMRQMQSGAGKAMGFGKSKAKLLTEK